MRGKTSVTVGAHLAAAVALACPAAGPARGAEQEAGPARARFAEFKALVVKGEPDGAGMLALRSARAPALASSAETFRSLVTVAASLKKRRDSMADGARKLVGREIELATRRGVRKGRLEFVTHEGLGMFAKVTIRGKVRGESRYTVKWADLMPEAETVFVTDWKPTGVEGALARTLVALSCEDKKGAARELEAAGDHAFAAYLRDELGVSKKPGPLGYQAGRDTKESSSRSGPPGAGEAGPYGYRTGDARLRAALAFGGSEASEAAVDRALAWLARTQEPDGRWSIKRWGGSKDEEACVGLTGLSLLAFLGAGHTENAGTHRKTVLKAVAYLIGRQDRNGAIGVNRTPASGGGYNHAISGLALAEAFGMARIRRTGVAAQRAVDYAVNVHMCDTGGWRYGPRMSPCTSVTGWFFAFLSSAKTARLSVDPKGFHGAKAWFGKVTTMPGRGAAGEVGRGRYQPGRNPTPSMTAIVVLGWLKMGLKRTSPLLTGGADYLVEDLPQWDRVRGNSFAYYWWYYGTHAMFQMGGDRWKKWNAATRDMLVRHQVAPGDPKVDGSWEPVYDGRHGGRVYSTAMACLCLEVYYRYKRLHR